MKELLRGVLRERDFDRLRILGRAARDLRGTFAPPAAQLYPIGLPELRALLRDFGIAAGDTVHVHTSISHLMRGSTTPPSEPVRGMRSYAKGLLDLLQELVGPEGTLMMGTDFDRPEGWLKRLAAGQELEGDVFDPIDSPSNRGLVSEYFRKQPGALRSVHPYYNVTARGPRAAELIADHHKSSPYAQDVHSPWYKLSMTGGKVLLLGRTFDINSLVHLVEYLHPDEYPRPLFMSKPLPMYYFDAERRRQRIEVLLHISGVPGSPLFTPQTLHAFGAYINERHRVYQVRQFEGDVGVVCYDAKAQYDAFLAEMRNNVTWYDPQFFG